MCRASFAEAEVRRGFMAYYLGRDWLWVWSVIPATVLLVTVTWILHRGDLRSTILFPAFWGVLSGSVLALIQTMVAARATARRLVGLWGESVTIHPETQQLRLCGSKIVAGYDWTNVTALGRYADFWVIRFHVRQIFLVPSLGLSESLWLELVDCARAHNGFRKLKITNRRSATLAFRSSRPLLVALAAGVGLGTAIAVHPTGEASRQTVCRGGIIRAPQGALGSNRAAPFA
ncbi:MAG TPA: hypothetical protein VGD78_12650 [Chthoniobacterales bacterium]